MTLQFLSLLFLSCIIPLYSYTIIYDLVSMSSGEVTKVSAVQPKRKCASAAAVKVMDLCLAILDFFLHVYHSEMKVKFMLL